MGTCLNPPKSKYNYCVGIPTYSLCSLVTSDTGSYTFPQHTECRHIVLRIYDNCFNVYCLYFLLDSHRIISSVYAGANSQSLRVWVLVISREAISLTASDSEG